MKEYKPVKNINTKPQILGLSISFFFMFLGVAIMGVFFNIGGISFMKFIITCTFIVIVYFVLKFLDSDTINRMGDQKLPKKIVVDNL